ncbi:MAG: TIGR00159 family protein [Ignavibacteriales bacterium]|nr:TIGR00159 family protein [Ignavibacteriales bacterium]
MIDLFSIGFLKITLIDLIDISVVAYILYKLYGALKGTVGSQILMGLLIVLLLSFISQMANLKALSWLLRFVTDIWVIAFIIVFQPELRRLLVIIARNPLFRIGAKSATPDYINIIVDAAFELSQQQHGALIVLIKSSGIRGFSETGEMLNAQLTKNLLRSIFYPRSPLHDGAVIVSDNIIEAARCTLPLSATTNFDGLPLGMRHRAGLGISEQADVLSVIVSEETGSISVAENGVIYRGLSRDALRNRLYRSTSPKTFKQFLIGIEGFFKKQK